MILEKKTHIESLSIELMSELLINLLPKLGLIEISRKSTNILYGSLENSVIGKLKTSYLFYNEDLNSANTKIDKISSDIVELYKEGIVKVHIVSNSSISNGFQSKVNLIVKDAKEIDFINGYQLIDLIDINYSEYWRHSDQSLIEYEKDYESLIEQSFEIKKLVEYKSEHQKLLSIFIEPNLYLRTQDKQSSNKAFTKISLDKLIEENRKLLIINGEPGVGKTRLLNEIGRNLIRENTKISGNKYLPVFIDSVNIRDAFTGNGEIDLCNLVIQKFLNNHFKGAKIETILDNYNLVLLIDTIDEFDDDYQSKIRSQLDELMDKGAVVYIGTRTNSLDEVYKLKSDDSIKNVFVQKFNDRQTQLFTERYFEGNGDRAQSLIESMKENKVLEKLPLTPLNLSLMSILYESTNQEVPSTLTDVYDKFSDLLLGRTMVINSIDFLDITIKENILGLYALELITRINGELMTKDEFIEFIKKELGHVKGTINFDLLESALDYIIEHTGLLVLYKNTYVKFRHDSYMEYFAAKEIFKNQRKLEPKLVSNFFDVNWQYAAIFYAGFSRKMPDFLKEIIKKVDTSSNLKEYWASVNGMGYLLQALYLTDDNIRKEGVKSVLLKMVETYETFKKLSASFDSNVSIGKFSLPLLGVLPVFMFQDSFDSITIKEPLNLALNELIEEYDEKVESRKMAYIDSIVYQILIIGITGSSNRLNMENRLYEILKKIKLTGNEFYTKILEISIENLGSKELRKHKDSILKNKVINTNSKSTSKFFDNKEINKYLLPANRNRFTKYDTLVPNKKIKLLVEGKTDAMILEHAYNILTGKMPYWEIKTGDEFGGGANELAKALANSYTILEEGQTMIGLFDNDDKGIGEFKGVLKDCRFDFLEEYDRIKKSKSYSIYGMLLPVPFHLQHYIKNQQKDNYFSIEHYFELEYLKNNEVVKESEIQDIWLVKDSQKLKFAQKVVKETDKRLFIHFSTLFKEIDKLTQVEEIEYYEG